jgi:hypothetical protein
LLRALGRFRGQWTFLCDLGLLVGSSRFGFVPALRRFHSDFELTFFDDILPIHGRRLLSHWVKLAEV